MSATESVRSSSTQLLSNSEYPSSKSPDSANPTGVLRGRIGSIFFRCAPPTAMDLVSQESSSTPLIEANLTIQTSSQNSLGDYHRSGPGFYLSRPLERSREFEQFISSTSIAGGINLSSRQNFSSTSSAIQSKRYSNPEQIEAHSKQMLIKGIEFLGHTHLDHAYDYFRMGLMNLDNPEPFHATDQTNALLMLYMGRVLMKRSMIPAAIKCFERGLCLKVVDETTLAELKKYAEFALSQK